MEWSEVEWSGVKYIRSDEKKKLYRSEKKSNTF